MDYRAVAELIWMSFLGLSVFGLVFGFSVRVFIGPVVRDALDRLGKNRSGEQTRADVRIEYLESRLLDMETELRRLAAAHDFDRQLGAGPSDAPDSGPVRVDPSARQEPV